MFSIFKEIKTYLEIKYNLARLDVTEKIIVIMTLVIQVFIFVMLSSVILFFLSLALGNYLGNCLNDIGLGFLIVTGIYGLILLLFIVFRKPLIINPLNKKLIHLLLTRHKEEENHEDEDEGDEI